jgi:hypothetical protein
MKPLLRSMKIALMPGAVERLHHPRFGGRPLWVLRSPAATSRATVPRATARRLHQHLQVEAIGKAPLNLADGVGGRVSMCRISEGRRAHWNLKRAPILP